MKVVGKWFLFGLLVVVVFLGFLPKEQLFYLAQEKLQDNGIVLRYEKMDESPLSLKLSKVKVYISKTPICVSDSVEASLFGIKARGIELLGLIGENFPKRVERADISYKRDFLKAFGEFGEAQGQIDTKKMEITIKIKPSKILQRKGKMILNAMKKEGDIYVYRYKI